MKKLTFTFTSSLSRKNSLYGQILVVRPFSKGDLLRALNAVNCGLACDELHNGLQIDTSAGGLLRLFADGSDVPSLHSSSGPLNIIWDVECYGLNDVTLPATGAVAVTISKRTSGLESLVMSVDEAWETWSHTRTP